MDSAFLPTMDQDRAVEVARQLGNCQTRLELDHTLSSALLPLLGCSYAIYTCLEEESNTSRFFELLDQSPLCWCQWQNILEFAAQSPMSGIVSGTTNNPALTNSATSSSRHCISNNLRNISRLCNHKNQRWLIHSLLDSPNPTVAVCFFHFCPQTQGNDGSCLKLAPLLQTTLLQTVKAIIFSEQCSFHELILQYLPGTEVPTAIMRDDLGIVYQNQAFKQLVEEQNVFPIHTLSSLLAPTGTGDSKLSGDPIKVGSKFYKAKVTKSVRSIYDRESLYLLQLCPVTDHRSEINLKFEKAGLTRRELDITWLIYQGKSARAISDKLHLSYHTVRNHIKHIYSKTGVSSLSELLVWSNQ